MATLALTAVGGAAGAAALPAGISVLGATIGGAAIGQAVGSIAGQLIDSALFGSSGQGQQRTQEGPRLSELQVSASTEGAHIPRLYGRSRLAGQIIWATRLEEEVITTTQTTGSSGGKSLDSLTGGGSARETVTTTEYRYYANIALGLCEGEITRVGRIWADGKELNLSEYTYRVYKGTETQNPDSLIESKEGSGNAPAYRGLAYIVFERMPLGRFGNRIPQLNFEVFRAVDDFEASVKAVTMIPSVGEFAYETSEILRDEGGGVTSPENVQTRQGGSNWEVSLNQLEDALPNVETVALIVGWFGTDLRAGLCELKPKVEVNDKVTTPESWQVAGLTRASADVVSLFDGRPAFGGTPNDASVVSAIQDLKARGKKVVFYPFILMDVPAGNILTDPYTGANTQALYPWRGRITCSPAPGQSGTPDKTPAAATQIASFVGTAAVSDYSVSGESVIYTGATEWSYRRMILHYAHLCKAAGGVDVFLLGSELRGLTTVRESASSFPFVGALATLAADVSGVLGASTKLSYAADWSEYFGYQPTDGTNDVYFHLDDLWSDVNIDAIGIDNYWPLTDWRDGASHLDYQAGYRSPYDEAYLRANVAGGEGYDWYYASSDDRDNQVRASITDGSGKPWVFRYKDIKSWWQNQHFNRPGGIESGTPTSWVPQSKPIWFTELGCPAVDKGSNQPNVFYDPKSSESFFPYFSRGVRDDLIQRRYTEAMLKFFDPSDADYISGSNPTSSVYADRMVDLENIYIYTWDARPYPAFPFNTAVWSDGDNWQFGHWLTGRVADAPIAQTLAKLLTDYGFADFETLGVGGVMAGYVIDRITSARDALQALELAFFLDSFESGGKIKFVQRGREGSSLTLTPDDLVEGTVGSELYQLTRQQETELPRSAKLTYVDASGSYSQAAVESRRTVVQSQRVSTAGLPIVMSQALAQMTVDRLLQDNWAARERGVFALPPSKLAFEPGDVMTLSTETRDFDMRLTHVSDSGQARNIEALSFEQEIYSIVRTPDRNEAPNEGIVFGAAIGLFLDLPLLSGNEVPHAGWLAAYQSPWPGQVAFYRSPEASNFNLVGLISAGAVTGITQMDFASGPTGRWDYTNTLRVQMDNGTLESFTKVQVLAGANLAAVQNADRGWEVIQFQTATLVSANVYELTVLLRGQQGTEDQMRDPVASGARFVMLDKALTQVNMSASEVGLNYNWRYGPANRAINDQSISSATHTFSGRGLVPLSPVHVKGQLDGSGNLNISWIRRTRIDGDPWEVVEVPLGELSERYEIDILDGGNVIRTLTSETPNVIYTASEQATDFSSIPTQFDINIYQLSSVYGRGIARSAIIP
ncbi:MAG: glycoside hydrolase/phage tail family protein [Pseudomonadota bacterium]